MMMFCQSRFWWSLLVGVDWWDAVGCTQSAAECGVGKRVNILLFIMGELNDSTEMKCFLILPA